MRKDVDSAKSKNFIKNNDISYDYVKKKVGSYCDQLGIDYTIHNYNGSFILFIKDKREELKNELKKELLNDFYLIYLDKQYIELKLLHVIEDKIIEIDRYNKNDCWYRALDKVKFLLSLHINKIYKLNKLNMNTYNNNNNMILL